MSSKFARLARLPEDIAHTDKLDRAGCGLREGLSHRTTKPAEDIVIFRRNDEPVSREAASSSAASIGLIVGIKR